MSADIEQFADGSAAFFSARKPAWHRLGTVTPNALTAEQALTTARLDWTVTLQPVVAKVDVGNGQTASVPVPDKYATVRVNPDDGEHNVLGVVGPQYRPVQNVDAFRTLDTIVDESGAYYETAGSLKNGRKVFMSMRLPDTMEFSNGDHVDLFLLASNSHDGSSSFTVAVTPVRVVCQNTLTVGLAQAKRTFSLRHTTNVMQRVNQARDALSLTFRYRDAFHDEVERLLAQDFTTVRFENMVRDLFPKQDTKHGATRASNDMDSLMTLWTAPTQANSAGTKWAAYNAFVEYVDWVQPVRGGGNADLRRAERTLTGAGDLLKQKALAYLR